MFLRFETEKNREKLVTVYQEFSRELPPVLLKVSFRDCAEALFSLMSRYNEGDNETIVIDTDRESLDVAKIKTYFFLIASQFAEIFPEGHVFHGTMSSEIKTENEKLEETRKIFLSILNEAATRLEEKNKNVPTDLSSYADFISSLKL
jgi:hypothetical protein